MRSFMFYWLWIGKRLDPPKYMFEVIQSKFEFKPNNKHSFATRNKSCYSVNIRSFPKVEFKKKAVHLDGFSQFILNL